MDSIIHRKGLSNRDPTTVIFNPDDLNQQFINSVRVSTSEAENQRSACLTAMKSVIKTDAVDSKINRTVGELKTEGTLKESQLQNSSLLSPRKGIHTQWRKKLAAYVTSERPRINGLYLKQP